MDTLVAVWADTEAATGGARTAGEGEDEGEGGWVSGGRHTVETGDLGTPGGRQESSPHNLGSAEHRRLGDRTASLASSYCE